MDFGQLSVRPAEGERLVISLRMHRLAAEKLAITAPGGFFRQTLEPNPPQLGGVICQWLRPEEKVAGDYRELSVVAACTGALTSSFSLHFPLPFLQQMHPAFQLAATIEGKEPVTYVANAARPYLSAGGDIRSFPGFLRLGMEHIGVTISQWRGPGGKARLPEGLDHIFFVLALVLAGGSVWQLLKSVTGFTLGHSLTLALATFGVIHVHSRWVEALIALSIAVLAGVALFRPRSPHRWKVAALFGLVHGLGFASVLHDLGLSRPELLKALVGFNLGVELGQCVIVLLALAVLGLLKRFSASFYLWTRQSLALALLLIGSYWFLVRALD